MSQKSYGSVCSGIEAASVAWHSLGWRAAWLAEIEPFPAAVLRHHYPDVPNYGDMTALAARVRELEIEAPDVLVGGTPCQAFSVAGLRQSLDDDRGQLTIKFLELAHAIDTVRRTRKEPECIIVWENVPGVLNTKDNAFGCFLAGLAGESEPLLPAGGRWTDAGCVYGPTRTVAWRVLDAQHFGLAQRRRRVFVVASARNDFDPAAVLFEFDGVRRDTAPSREARQEAAGDAGAGTAGGDVINPPAKESVTAFVQNSRDEVRLMGGDGGIVGALAAEAGIKQQCYVTYPIDTLDANNGSRLHNGVTSMAHGQGGAEIGFDRGPTLTCNHKARETDVAQPIFCIKGAAIGRKPDAGPQYGETLEGIAYTLNCTEVHGVATSYSVRTANTSSNGWGIQHEVTHTLDATAGPAIVHGVAYPIDTWNAMRDPDKHDEQNRQGCGLGDEGDPAPTLTKAHVHGVATAYSVRTPGNIDNSSTTVVQQPVAHGCLTPELPQRVRVHGTAGTSPTLSSEHGRGHGVPTIITAAVPVTVGTLSCNTGPNGHDAGNFACNQAVDAGHVVPTTTMQVRRLTPVECERLQGFPDTYTAIPWRKKPASECPDGPRYKALGNSMAVPVMRWIGERIDNFHRALQTDKDEE